jgi:hypothetical protein
MTTLTIDDYDPTGGWPEIELGEDRESARAFWASVLQLAMKSGVTSVRYAPHDGEDNLTILVSGEEHPYIAPPHEYADWLLRIGCELLTGGPYRAGVRRWWSKITGRPLSGRITVEIFGGRLQWLGSCRWSGKSASLVLDADWENAVEPDWEKFPADFEE